MLQPSNIDLEDLTLPLNVSVQTNRIFMMDGQQMTVDLYWNKNQDFSTTFREDNSIIFLILHLLLQAI